MTEENVFDSVKTTEKESEQSQETQSILDELVGEDKKFKSVEDLAKGKRESDMFISQLQEELRGMREDLSKRATTEELLAMLKEKQSQPSESKENTTPQLSQEDIAKLVNEQLKENKTLATKEENIKQVGDRLVQTYGEKSAEVLANKARELNVSVDFLKSTAESSPNAFYQLIGLNKPGSHSQGVKVEQSSVNTSVDFQPSGLKPGTKAYYEALRKSDSRKYWTPEIQNQIFQAKKAGTY